MHVTQASPQSKAPLCVIGSGAGQGSSRFASVSLAAMSNACQRVQSRARRYLAGIETLFRACWREDSGI